jgi:hypothetical protein
MKERELVRSRAKLSGPRKLFAGGLLILVAAGCKGTAPASSASASFSGESPSPTMSFAPVPSQSPDITPTPTLVPEPIVTPIPEIPHATVLSEVRTGLGSEPSVAASPYDASLVAMSYNYTALDAGIPQDGVRISQDGGKTWKEVAREPWKGHVPDYHGVVAWGPGETPGSSRLWWTDAIVEAKGKVVQAVAYSDNLGGTWNFHIFTETPPWIGGFPNLTVDNNPQSPNFGTTYVAYNWLESAKGPGLAVAASRDGKTWQEAQVPAPEVPGYPYYWRISYNPKPTSTGVDVLFYQSSVKYWNENNVFSEGIIGDARYYLAELSFDKIVNVNYSNSGDVISSEPNYSVTYKLKVDDVLPAPAMQGSRWGSSYDPETQSGFAIDQNDNAWIAFTSAGKINIGEIDTYNNNSSDYLRPPLQEPSPWMAFCLSGATCFEPSLVIGIHNEIVVGFHAIKNGMESTYFMVSYDNGDTWQPPQPVTKSAWRVSVLSNVLNGTGLRENMAVGPNGEIYYTYADPRSGRLSTYVAVIDLGDNKTP